MRVPYVSGEGKATKATVGLCFPGTNGGTTAEAHGNRCDLCGNKGQSE